MVAGRTEWFLWERVINGHKPHRKLISWFYLVVGLVILSPLGLLIAKMHGHDLPPSVPAEHASKLDWGTIIRASLAAGSSWQGGPSGELPGVAVVNREGKISIPSSLPNPSNDD